ncbi:hypothetical protein [Paenibacillus sp. FSL K6-2524]|uniref:hypothetical protein n=1 Tax=Paenibacillus sp. FSL K6-2524 TaxID=2954516 RepID=UPI0030FA4BAA
MKKIITGGILLCCGIILYLGGYIPAAHYASELGGWSTPPGRLGTALEATGGKSAINNSMIMMIIGFFLLAWGCFSDEIIRIQKLFKQDNLKRMNRENE